MDTEEFLEWAFEAPNDVLTVEEFRSWKMQKMQQEAEEILKEIGADPSLRNIEVSKEQREELYNKIMQKVKEKSL